MKPLLLLPIGVACLGIGAAVGLVVGTTDTPEAPTPTDVVVRSSDGDVRAYTPEAAAARIESLEDVLRRRDARHGARDTEPTAEAAVASDGDAVDRFEPPLLRPDGRAYTPDELRALARGSQDPDLRARAIRALRRVDSDAARTTLAAILDDPETTPDMRLLAAQMLTRPPHRDHLPEELIRRLAEETVPEIRQVLAEGVARLSDRGAWMREISGLLGDEADADVRRTLLGAVARTARDRAARQELLAIAARPGAPADERALALAALTRSRPDKETVDALRPLLTDGNPEVRAQALRILAADRAMPLATLRAGLADADPGVRATALSQALAHLPGFARDKDAPKGPVNATTASAVLLATSDPDIGVRRAGVAASRYLPSKQRDAVLAAGRQDADLGVRLVAYANSPRQIAIEATPEFVGALSSPDPRQRDYAYSQLARLHDLRVPFQGGWNDAARAAAIEEIRLALSGSR